MYKSAVDFDKFLEWANQHFKDIKVTDNKIRLNSIYCDHLGGDGKNHLWCRPYTGYYHCYKSGKRGSLYDLVIDVEKCSYYEAVDLLDGRCSLRYLESQLEAFFASEASGKPVIESPKLTLPDNSVLVTKLLPPYQTKVVNYLESRKIPSYGLYYCISGEYSGRIVIPYYNSDGELIYWNARDIRPESKLRYRGPEISTGFKKEQAVWMSFFPKKGAKIYLTEGEFDAMTLNLCGFHGCATGGKDVGEHQIALIKDYDICLAFDRDRSGKEASIELGWTLYENGISRVSFVVPPEPYKDWNEMLTGKDDKSPQPEKIIHNWIEKNEKPFNQLTALLLNY